MPKLRLTLLIPGKLPALSLSPDQEQQIRQWLTAHGTPQQVALRGRIILAAAQGRPEATIARQLGTHRKTVRLWRGRFAQRGLESLWESPPGAAIMEFLEAWNDDPRPFVWTATVESIVEKLSRCRQTLEQIKPGCTQPRSRKTSKRLST